MPHRLTQKVSPVGSGLQQMPLPPSSFEARTRHTLVSRTGGPLGGPTVQTALGLEAYMSP